MFQNKLDLITMWDQNQTGNPASLIFIQKFSAQQGQVLKMGNMNRTHCNENGFSILDEESDRDGAEWWP